ncbi:MAG: hypothetical protein HC933_02175 [Pleurocapsa sp. SU_196_0]|nr:hypothetical protein [Pleurocapsa sp. SU_196_0]
MRPLRLPVSPSSTAGNATGGALGAFGPVGAAIGLGAGLLGLLISSSSNTPTLNSTGKGSGSFARDGSSPAIENTANAYVTVQVASFNDPLARQQIKDIASQTSLELLAQLGLIDPTKVKS